MNICYVISTPEVAGGANRSLLDMILLVKKAGHECFVLGPSYGSMAEELTKQKIEYITIPFKSSVKHGNFLRNFAKYIYNLWIRQSIKRLLKNREIDIVHNNSLPTLVGMEAAYSLKIPYVCHIRENIWNGLGMEFINNSDAHKVIKNASTNIAISEFIKTAYQQYEPKAEYIVVNDGIRVDDYYENKEILCNNTIKIGIIGVINPQKGQEDIVHAIEILRTRGYEQIELEIIGKEGSWRGNKSYALNLKDYVKEKKLTCVKFILPIENVNELKARRKKHDINVICSRAEGLGRTTIESMLSGTLTIAANAGATNEIINNMEQGILYECGDPYDLANKIEYAINNRDLMKEIAKKGQSYAIDRFSIEKYTSSILKIYNKVCE